MYACICMHTHLPTHAHAHAHARTYGAGTAQSVFSVNLKATDADAIRERGGGISISEGVVWTLCALVI